MSRFRRAFHGVASSYLALIGATCYGLASLPLALHYLSNERFALWALMSSIGGYLSLIDLGMSGSVARLLIDHKDQRHEGTYGSLVLTGWLVLVVQGAILFCAGFALAPWTASLLKIPAELNAEFVALVRWQGVVLGLGFALRIFSHVLYANQRQDVMNYAQLANLALNLVLLWLFFRAGQGVFSLIWSALISSGFAAVVQWLACWRLELLPEAGCWGRPAWSSFRELFVYGKDLFLMAVGGQLILASQTMVITRRVGLEAAAAWAVGTKVFNLVTQLIWRIYDGAAPGMAEMLARGEATRVLERYKTLLILSTSSAAFCAVAYAMCNSLFVTVLTAGRIAWPPLNDALLGIWMILSAVVHCHNCFIGATKEIRFMRYILILEGIVFVAVGLAVVREGQLHALILTSIGCSAAFSCAYGAWRVARFFRLPLWQVTWEWGQPVRAFMLRFAPLAGLVWIVTRSLPTIPRLLLHGFLCASLGAYLFARYGVPSVLQSELVQRLPKRIGRFLALVFGLSDSLKRCTAAPRSSSMPS